MPAPTYTGYNPWANAVYGQNPYYGYTWQPVQTQPAQPQYSQQNTVSQPQPQPQMKQPINWVKSEREVDEAYVEPNSAGVFWNENEPIIYLKKVDGTGKASKTIYDIIERKQPVNATEVESQSSPSKDEFTQLVGVVNTLNNSVTSMLKEIDTIKTDMYGVAGRKKSVKRSEAEEDG